MFEDTSRKDFGIGLAAVDADEIVVLGAGFLFDVQGHLLGQFRKPVPPVGPMAQTFSSVAAIGQDKVIFGAIESNLDDLSGMAFIYDLQGNLLTTLNDPIPASASFGGSVAAMGTDRVVVGGGLYPGAAYLFDLQGNLEATFADPQGRSFGLPVAASGTDKALVGGPDSTVSLFHLEDISSAPNIICPSDITVPFTKDVPPPQFTGSVSDPSDPNPHVYLVQQIFINTANTLHVRHSASYIHRIYRAVNAKGISRDCTQVITIESGPADVNGDGTVDMSDLQLVLGAIRNHSTSSLYDANGDGRVDIADARYVVLHFTNPNGAP
jgi:hypothetical protein